MTRVTLVRWTCNMCLTVVETEDDQRPTRWVSYSLVDVGDPAQLIPLGHLCDTCRDEVQGLIDHKRRENTTTVVGGRLTFGGVTIAGGGIYCVGCKQPLTEYPTHVEGCPNAPVVHRADWTEGDVRPICQVYEYAGHDGPCRVRS